MRRIDFDRGYIVVAPVDSTAEQSPLLTKEDHTHLATLTSPTRRAQWCTWRSIVRAELGAEVSLRYNSMGAPLLEQAVGKVAYISVSHSAEWVAVMFSTTRCGVDIESHQRNFSKVATRYITPEERETFAEEIGPHFEAIVWSAKEAMYKYALTPGVDFTGDLLIVGHDSGRKTLRANLNGFPIPDTRYLFLEDNQVLCYTFEF